MIYIYSGTVWFFTMISMLNEGEDAVFLSIQINYSVVL